MIQLLWRGLLPGTSACVAMSAVFFLQWCLHAQAVEPTLLEQNDRLSSRTLRLLAEVEKISSSIVESSVLEQRGEVGSGQSEREAIRDLLDESFWNPLIEEVLPVEQELSHDDFALLAFMVLTRLYILQEKEGRDPKQPLHSPERMEAFVRNHSGEIEELLAVLRKEEIGFETYFNRLRGAMDLHWLATQKLLLDLDGEELASFTIFDRSNLDRRLLHGRNGAVVEWFDAFDSKARRSDLLGGYGRSRMAAAGEPLKAAEDLVLRQQFVLSIFDGAVDAYEYVAYGFYVRGSVFNMKELIPELANNDFEREHSGVVSEVVDEFVQKRRANDGILSIKNFNAEAIVDIHFELMNRLFPELDVDGSYDFGTNIREPRYRFRFHLDPELRERFLENLKAAGFQP